MSTATIEQSTTPRMGEPAAAPSLLRLTRVELRKTYDTRAGFWLLLVVALASLAVVTLQLFFAEEPDKTFDMFFAVSYTHLTLPTKRIV